MLYHSFPTLPPASDHAHSPHPCATLTANSKALHIRICDAAERVPRPGGSQGVALPVKALKVGQESYWLDQIARDREEYFSGRGESPGRFVGSIAEASGLEGVAASERVKVETVERVARKLLGIDPHELYGEHFDHAWQHRGKRVDGRVASFDHCFSSPKSVSLLAAGGGEHVRRELAAGRAEALGLAIGYLERQGRGVRRDHNGT